MGLRDIVEQRRAENSKPKSLRELRERKQAERASKPDPRKNGLAALRESKMRKESSKLDFAIGGVRFHNAQPVNGYWTVDVTNGDKTYTLHNRHGAWMHNLADREGYMKEPVVVARMLGTNIGQLEMCQNLTERMEREQKLRGVPTREQAARMREEQAMAERRRRRKKTDDDAE